MDIKKVIYFIEAVKYESIIKAAKALEIDQSILSRTLRALEEEVKAQLYIHYNKSFKLTEKGKLAYKYFKKFAADYQDLQDSLHNDRPERIELRILSSNGSANYYLIEAAPDFLDKHPNIFLSFSTNDLIQKLDVDIDICIGPKLEGENIENFYLFSYFLKLFASKKYLESKGYPEQPSDLDDHQLIGYSRTDISTFIDFDWHLRYGAVNNVPRKPYLQVSSSYAIQRAAQNNLGIITFCRFLVDRDNLGLIDLFPLEKGLKVDVYFSHRKKHQSEREIILYRDYLMQYLKKLPFE